jgi:tripartite-type tricarboxylate transporter receptor subunit TctC
MTLSKAFSESAKMCYKLYLVPTIKKCYYSLINQIVYYIVGFWIPKTQGGEHCLLSMVSSRNKPSIDMKILPRKVVSMTRQCALMVTVCISLGLVLVPSAQAQNYPVKPVRLVVGFTPGTTVDFLGRLVAQKLGEVLGQQVIVDNKPGASSTIAAAIVARAPGDGYTLLFCSTGTIFSQFIYKNLTYDLKRDFAPVVLVAMVPNVLVVNPSLPVRDIRGLIELAKAKPGQLNYSHSGKGSASHMSSELFKAMANADIRDIPYKSSAQALTDVLSGEVLFNYPSCAAAVPHVRSGRVRALAVSGANRSQALPDVPAMAEFLPGYEASGAFSILAPQSTPAGLVARLNKEIVSIVNTPDMKEKMASQGAEVVGSSPEELANFMREAQDKWGKLVKQLNIPLM